jgi:2-methylcitrate dehydratase PrpD
MPPDDFERTLARLVASPPRLGDMAKQRARAHVVDTLGVMIAGAPERGVHAVVACAAEVPGTGGIASVVTRKRMAPRDAALCNGMAGHAHDFDDDEPHVIVGHPSVAVLAALLAVAPSASATVANLLDAYVVGTETMFRIGSLVNPRHYNAGWHCTASLGVFGAAAACANLLAMPEGETANALNVAAGFAGGLRENFGSDGKPLQVGVAAANGVFACELARGGLRGASAAISGRQGFLAMNDGRDAAQALECFGKPWGIEQPGFNVKLYPCCSSTHTALDGIFELLSRSSWRADDIESIDVWIGEDVPGILIHDVPRTGLQGKFSMRYCIAYAAAHGEIGISAFTDAAVGEPRVLQMLHKVRTHVDATLPREVTGVTHQSRVRVTARSGEQVECSHAHPRGSPDAPCSAKELREKFLECVGYGFGASCAARTWDALAAVGGEQPAGKLLAAVHEGLGR